LAGPGRDPARLAGGVYAANTAGAIAGALGTSLWLLPGLGSQATQRALIVVAGAAGMLALSRLREPHVPPASAARQRPEASHSRAAGILELAGIVVSVLLAVASVLPVPAPLIAYGRQTAEWAEAARVADPGSILFTGEGRHEFVAVSQGP